MKVALATPHCRWDPHRVASLARLQDELGIRNDRDELPAPLSSYKVFDSIGPTPNHVWSGWVFEWLAAQDADYVMQLQDDVTLCPDFLKVVEAMLSGAPEAEVIACFTIAPHAAVLSTAGNSWLTTADWLTGPCWITRTSFMREFWHWRQNRLRAGWQARIKETSMNEDTLLGMGAAALGRKVWTPLPAIVDHDTGIPSTYGNTNGKYNRASLPWQAWLQLGGTTEKLRDPAYWKPRNVGVPGSTALVPHFGCAYGFTYHNYLRWTVDDGGVYGGLDWGLRADAIRADVVRWEVTPQ